MSHVSIDFTVLLDPALDERIVEITGKTVMDARSMSPNELQSDSLPDCMEGNSYYNWSTAVRR